MVNPSRSSLVKCTRHEYQNLTGAIVYKWQRQWAAIRLPSTSFGTTTKPAKAVLTLLRRTGTSPNLYIYAGKNTCGCCCAPVLMYARNGILADCLPIC